MPFTQADLDNLKRAVASGVLKVQYKDRSVEYASMAGLLLALQLVENELATLSGAAVSTRQIRVYTTKGYSNRDWY